MRTIVINTLSSELSLNPLFYLPFDENQFHWIQKELGKLSECPTEISLYNDSQDKNRCYRMVILVSLAGFKDARHRIMRQNYKELLNAYINHSVFNPMVKERIRMPEGVSLVYVMPDPVDGDGDITAGMEYDRIFRFPEDLSKLENLTVSSDDGKLEFDMTEMYACQIKDFKNSYQTEVKTTVHDKPRNTVEDFRHDLAERTKVLQDCKYFRPGNETAVSLPVDIREFFPKTNNWSLLSVDIQMNLSNHLADHLKDDQWKIQLTEHTEEEIQLFISRAKARVNTLLDNPAVLYFPLERENEKPIENDITNEIWSELIDKKDLPWLNQVKDYYDKEQNGQKNDSPVKKLRHAWFLISKQKKKFDAQYEMLYSQFDGEEAKRQERDILDTCLEKFGSWRKKRLSASLPEPKDGTVTEMPVFDDTRAKEEIEKSRQAYGKSSAESLSSYDDLRTEAEEVKAKVKKAYRLWPGDCSNATKNFFIYSVVLAAVFLIQMILPYLGITMTEGATMERYLHLFASLSVFAGLYFAGVLLWMRSLCDELYEYTNQMQDIINRSNARRRDSVINAVNLYGHIMPECTEKYEELKRLERINSKNLKRKEHFNAHIMLLEKADEILEEMITLLRLSSVGTGEIKPKKVINYELPPSHEDNVPLYALFSESWGV